MLHDCRYSMDDSIRGGGGGGGAIRLLEVADSLRYLTMSLNENLSSGLNFQQCSISVAILIGVSTGVSSRMPFWRRALNLCLGTSL